MWITKKIKTRTQIVYQWVEWLTRLATEDEAPNIYWLIAVLTGTKNRTGIPTPVLSHGHSQQTHTRTF